MTEGTKRPNEERRTEPKRPNPPGRDPDVSSPEHVEEALDEALAESFPASDPVSISPSRQP
jgi:hypothetical protein